jgi:hypothetical protein
MGIVRIDFNGVSFEENDAIITRAQKILIQESKKMELSDTILLEMNQIEKNIQIDSFKFFIDDETDFSDNEIIQLVLLLNNCIDKVSNMTYIELNQILQENIPDDSGMKKRIVDVFKLIIKQINSISN